MSLFNNIGAPSMETKLPSESKSNSTFPMYLVLAYACKIGTILFLALVTYSGYEPYGFSILGGVPAIFKLYS